MDAPSSERGVAPNPPWPPGRSYARATSAGLPAKPHRPRHARSFTPATTSSSKASSSATPHGEEPPIGLGEFAGAVRLAMLAVATLPILRPRRATTTAAVRGTSPLPPPLQKEDHRAH